MSRPEYRWMIEPVRRMRVMTAVCDEFGLSHEDLQGAKRTNHLFRARMAYSYIMRTYFKDTLQQIAQSLKLADHGAVINQIATCNDLIFKNDPIKQRIQRIEQQLLTKQLI